MVKATQQKRIRVIVVGKLPGECPPLGQDAGTPRISVSFFEKPIRDLGSMMPALLSGYDVVLWDGRVDLDNWLQEIAATASRMPVILAVDNVDQETVLKLLAQGVQEVVDHTHCTISWLETASVSAVARFRASRLADISQAGDLPKVEEKALQTLDRLPFGVIFTNRNSEVLFLNSKARKICGNGSGIFLSDDNRCCAINNDNNAALHRLISRVSDEADSTEEGNYILRVEGEGNESTSVLVIPVGNKVSNHGVALFLNTGGGFFDISADIIKSVYSLTDSEAHLLLGLVRGQTLAEIAEERGVTLHTVRAQLKSVFSKTGTKRQASLIKQVLTGPAVLMHK
ncbi:MAG: helix-turn-helix transcriptional regulator [Candidatus Sedimenticola sp. 20ELBAFRAG]